MPEYIITDPQTGRKIKMIGDSAPSEQEIAEAFGMKSAAPASKPELTSKFEGDGSSYWDRVKAGFSPQRLAGSQPARALAGAVSPVVAAAQGGAMVGDVIAEKMGYEGDTAKKIGSAWGSLRDYQQGGRDGSGLDLEYMAGNIGTGLALASKIPAATSTLGGILQGGATGAGLAMTNPATSEHPGAEKLAQALTGVVAGAAVPTAGAAWRFGADRLTQKGIERQVGRLLNEAAGPRRDAVIQALRSRSGNPPVGPRPLSAPTAGQSAASAGSAEFSALQRIAATRADPSTYSAINSAQTRAQIDALRRIGGSADDLATQTKAATNQISQLYDDAFNAPLQATDDLTNILMNDPYVAEATKIADKVARSRGVPQGTTEYMHLIKKGLDDLVSTPAAPGGMGATEKSTIEAVRQRFINALGKSNPVYDAARLKSQELYKPLSQMRVGQEIEQRFSPALTDLGAEGIRQRPAALAQALRDAPGTVRRATGFKGAQSIDDIMNPDQMELINKVGRDVANNADFERLAQQGGSRVNEMLNNMYTEKAGSMLSRVMMIFNTILSRTGRAATGKGMKVVADVMRDPLATADLMEAATTAERSQIQALLQNALSSQGGAATSSAIGAAEDYMRNEQ